MTSTVLLKPYFECFGFFALIFFLLLQLSQIAEWHNRGNHARLPGICQGSAAADHERAIMHGRCMRLESGGARLSSLIRLVLNLGGVPSLAGGTIAAGAMIKRALRR